MLPFLFLHRKQPYSAQSRKLFSRHPVLQKSINRSPVRGIVSEDRLTKTTSLAGRSLMNLCAQFPSLPFFARVDKSDKNDIVGRGRDREMQMRFREGIRERERERSEEE